LTVFNNQVVGGLLKNIQMLLVFKGMANGGLVTNTVGLGTGGAHGRALAGIEHPKLYATTISTTGHEAAEGIYLFDQVALADSAYGRVAGHLSQSLDIVGQQQSMATHTGAGSSGLGTGMAATNDNDIVSGFVLHKFLLVSTETEF
jgi:hypothetical protein